MHTPNIADAFMPYVKKEESLDVVSAISPLVSKYQKLIRDIDVEKAIPVKKVKVKNAVFHDKKARYVYAVTIDPSADHDDDEKYEDELDSPSLSEIGSEEEEGDIYEHLDEQVPTKTERYEGSGAAIWFIQGCKQAERHKWQKAIDYYQQGIKLDRNYTNIVYNMGCAFERRNNWSLAKKWFIKALRNTPGSLKFVYALALVSYKIGEYGD